MAYVCTYALRPDGGIVDLGVAVPCPQWGYVVLEPISDKPQILGCLTFHDSIDLRKTQKDRENANLSQVKFTTKQSGQESEWACPRYV
jgi:hypothetical protein